jgi:ubiquinone/menaquinone biosynthesis C-methylase UbiE
MSDELRAADLDVPVSVPAIQQFYSQVAPGYDEYTEQFEAAAKARGVELLAREPGERYLEVATGGGANFGRVAQATGIDGMAGVDLAPGMIEVARGVLASAGLPAPLVMGDARRLPVASESVDCLLNSYMLDLIPNDEMATVLGEFHRVLRPGGRLVLVNLTEGEGADEAFSVDWKRRYEEDPVQLGACRPVVVTPLLPQVGFDVRHREYVGGEGRWPAEVVLAIRA